MGAALITPPSVRDVYELVRQYFGVRGQLNRTISMPAVPVTPTQILKRDATRVLYLISNPSANNVWVAEIDTVSTTLGYLLQAGGGVITRKWLDDLASVADELWAVAAAAGTTLYVVEWRLF